MKRFIVGTIFVLLYGCASQQPSYENQEHLLIVTKQFDRKSKSIVNVPSDIVKGDSEGEPFLGLISHGRYEKRLYFPKKYVEEYLYLINEYENKHSNKIDLLELGQAHARKASYRLGFTVFGGTTNLLAIDVCLHWSCENPEKSAVLLDLENARKLKQYFISELGTYSASNNPGKRPIEDKALVYFYRLNSVPTAIKAPIAINGTVTEKLPVNSHFWKMLDPGSYKISVEGRFMVGLTGDEKTFNFS